MKLLAEQHAEHLEIETEKQNGRRSAYVMKLSNTSYTTYLEGALKQDKGVI